jgi:putative hemolysin
VSAWEAALWWAVAVGSVAASAVFSGMEIAFYSINRVRLVLRAGRTPPDAAAVLVRRELEQPDRLLATLLVGNNIVGYMSAVAIATLLESRVGSPGLVALLNTCVLAPVLFIFAESLPKELFRVEADRLAYALSRPVAAVRLALTAVGVLPLIQALIRSVERLSGLPRERISDARQRMALLLKEGAGHGVLSESQVTLVDRALMLRSVTVGDEMIPWSLVRAVPADADRRRAGRIIGASRHVHFPVVDPRGLVVGIVSQVDLYTQPDAPVAELARPAVRFGRGVPVREALLLVREHGSRMGIVEDGAGRPVGIVTPKDLIEPLTGEVAEL